jgi:hypothetical protein
MTPRRDIHRHTNSGTLWTASALLISALIGEAAADVSYSPKSGDMVGRIMVSGEIRKEDLGNFTTFVGMARKETLYQVLLDSKGGDVETAISMGKILRADGEKAYVAVMEGNSCVSSCVFLLAGGSNRDVWGRVGIHRPFSPADTRTTATLQKQNYERLEAQIKGFLRDSNIPPELFDHMMRIPPEKMKYLSKDELQRYGLNENDPFQDAARVAAVAKNMGITTKELLSRQARVNAECKSGVNKEDPNRCAQRIFEGR